MLKHLIAGSVLVACTAASSAVPFAPPMPTQSQIVLVAGGCGPAFHRDPYGVCVPNRRVVYVGPPGPAVVVGAPPPVVMAPVIRLPPPCPRGYHRDPDPARPICYPN